VQQAALSSLTFDPTSHVYHIYGVRVPSVTGVLKQTGYINLAGIPSDVLEEARARGGRVHAALHYLLENDLDISTVDEADRGYLESAEQYLAKHVHRVMRAEFRVWSERHGCAGTLDMIAIHDDGCLSIDDFKTGDPADVAADLQTAAYLGFLLELCGKDSDLHSDLSRHARGVARMGRRSIRLYRDGRPAKETPYTDHRDYVRFINALNVVNDLAKRPAPQPWDEER
jgi:hypothetical protein